MGRKIDSGAINLLHLPRSVCVLFGSLHLTLRSRTSYSEVRGKASLALRGHRGGLGRSDVVVKLITPRFTPLLYISREKYLISRFLTKNLYKCGTPHKYIISKRTLRTSWLHFRKYIYLGYITYNKRGLNIRGSVLSYFVLTPTPCPLCAVLVKV